MTLLLHDWGCLFGYHFARLHPQLVVRIAEQFHASLLAWLLETDPKIGATTPHDV